MVMSIDTNALNSATCCILCQFTLNYITLGQEALLTTNIVLLLYYIKRRILNTTIPYLGY